MMGYNECRCVWFLYSVARLVRFMGSLFLMAFLSHKSLTPHLGGLLLAYTFAEVAQQLPSPNLLVGLPLACCH
jgi:hypothetical protein